MLLMRAAGRHRFIEESPKAIGRRAFFDWMLFPDQWIRRDLTKHFEVFDPERPQLDERAR